MLSNLPTGTTIEKAQAGVVEKTIKEIIPEEITNLNPNDILTLGVDVDVIMDVLQNRMYTRKDIAFQELPTNGRDAILRRIKLGDTNFKPEIQIIVNQDDNTISISDNGCGLSEDKIKQVYRFYGRSDKRNSIDETGMFGLGSKTPFALVDEFTVTTDSMEDKTRRTYLVTKRGLIVLENEPSISPGTTITFNNAKDYGISTINTICSKIFKAWKCPVNVYTIFEGNKVFYIDVSAQKESTLEDVNEGVYPDVYALKIDKPYYTVYITSDDNNFKNSIYVGFIPYDTEYSELGIENLVSDFKYRNQMSIFIKNPNIVTISATREGIEKDSKLKQLITNINFEIKKVIKKELKATFEPDIDWSTFKPTKQMKDLYNLSENMHRHTDYGGHRLLDIYPNIKLLFKQNFTYATSEDINKDSLFTILEYADENKHTIKWSPKQVVKSHTVPECEVVILLNNKSGSICRKEHTCVKCSLWTSYSADGVYECDRSLTKEHHVLEKAFPEFVPKKGPNKSSFKLRNLVTNRSHIYSLYDLTNNFGHILFTSDEFGTNDNNIYQISPNRLKDLLKIDPSFEKRVITKEKYYKDAKLKDIINGKEYKIEEIENKFDTLVITDKAEYYEQENSNKLEITAKLFDDKKTLFSDNYHKSNVKLTDTEIISYSEFIKDKSVNMLLNCKIDVETAIEIINTIENKKYKVSFKKEQIVIDDKSKKVKTRR